MENFNGGTMGLIFLRPRCFKLHFVRKQNGEDFALFVPPRMLNVYGQCLIPVLLASLLEWAFSLKTAAFFAKTPYFFLVDWNKIKK